MPRRIRLGNRKASPTSDSLLGQAQRRERRRNAERAVSPSAMHDAPSCDRADGATHVRSTLDPVYPVVPPPVQHSPRFEGARPPQLIGTRPPSRGSAAGDLAGGSTCCLL